MSSHASRAEALRRALVASREQWVDIDQLGESLQVTAESLVALRRAGHRIEVRMMRDPERPEDAPLPGQEALTWG